MGKSCGLVSCVRCRALRVDEVCEGSRRPVISGIACSAAGPRGGSDGRPVTHKICWGTDFSSLFGVRGGPISDLHHSWPAWATVQSRVSGRKQAGVPQSRPMTKTKQNNTNKNKTTTQQTTTQTEQTKDNAHNRNKNENTKPTNRASRQKSINSFVAQTKPKTPKKTQPNEQTVHREKSITHNGYERHVSYSLVVSHTVCFVFGVCVVAILFCLCVSFCVFGLLHCFLFLMLFLLFWFVVLFLFSVFGPGSLCSQRSESKTVIY